jgi:hypothetical protein
VARKWLPWSLGLIFALTIGWVAFVARSEVVSGQHDSISETAIAVVNRSALATPLIILFSMFIITFLDSVGGLLVVTYRYLSDKFLEPQREKIRAKARAEARAEGKAAGLAAGRAAGLAAGRAEERRMWEDWFRRREEAEKKGEPFDEPPPGADSQE